MSYCRWSSMNWMCDVYVYEDVSGGWTTHVAGNRRIFQPIPDFFLGGRTPNFGGKWDEATHTLVYPNRALKAVAHIAYKFFAFWHNRVHMTALNLIPSRKIGLPHDGESFNDSTPCECADRLCELKRMGYNVPQYAIDALRNEDKDATQEEP